MRSTAPTSRARSVASYPTGASACTTRMCCTSTVALQSARQWWWCADVAERRVALSPVATAPAEAMTAVIGPRKSGVQQRGRDIRSSTGGYVGVDPARIFIRGYIEDAYLALGEELGERV